MALNGNSGSDNVLLFKFDAAAGTTTLVDSQKYNATTLGGEWSHDGLYYAVAGHVIGGASVAVYEFDAEGHTLTLRDSIASAGNSMDVSWSPDNSFLAVASLSTAANEVAVYRFDRATKTAIFVDGVSLGDTGSVAWSPSGNYLVSFGAASSGLRLYSFDGTTLTLEDSDTGVQTAPSGSSYFSSVDWAPSEKFFAIAGISSTSEVAVYSFDKTTGTFSQEATHVDPDGHFDPAAFWSPDGSVLLVGRGNNSTTENTFILTGFSFPENNVIHNNTVYCNSGAGAPSGFGISGSSIFNSIIGNTAFNNPIPRGEREPSVSSNYAFVTNVFNQLFGDAPTMLQNISASGMDPILKRYDIPTQLLRLDALAESLINNLL